MSRRIVIVPSFASSHFLKCAIPNWIETLNPDVILINESIFPEGPENKGHIDEEFRKKWTYSGNSDVGFDSLESIKIAGYVEKELIQKMGIIWKPKIIFNPIKYTSSDVNQCFIQAMTEFVLDVFQPEIGDLIFPLEPDALLFEGDIEVINQEIMKLKPGEGISVKWMDFLETQYYTEAINLQNPKFRRFCYCFDSMENYQAAIDGFTSQNYPKLKTAESFFIRHYCWMTPPKWKELRFDLIYRSDPNYWKSFNEGLNWIRLKSEVFKKRSNLKYEKPDDIIMRPSRTDAGRFATFIDIEHPKAIMNHPNFVK